MLGHYRNIGSELTPKLVTADDAEGQESIWCGLIPRAYEGYWPNVAQFAFYSIFLNTGNTVELAWTGVVGTFGATLNFELMMLLYPDGGEQVECTAESAPTRNCTAVEGEMIYLDPDYSPALVWLDAMLVLILYLISKAPTNMLCFGMSWHISFMMNFMSPTASSSKGQLASPIPGINWDSEASIVMCTSIAGAVLAIVSTIFPRALLNTRKLHEKSWTSYAGMNIVWNDAIDYYCGKQKTAKRFQMLPKRMRCVRLSQACQVTLPVLGTSTLTSSALVPCVHATGISTHPCCSLEM